MISTSRGPDSILCSGWSPAILEPGSSPYCHARFRFMAKEKGIVPIPKKIMLSGMPIPVNEKTAAKG